MQALAALVLLAAHAHAGARFSSRYRAPPSPAYTLNDAVDDLATYALKKLDGDEARWPIRVVRCARELGVSRCVKAFALCRAERAAHANGSLQFDLREELERQFPWERFAGASEDEMDELVLGAGAGLLEKSDLTLTYPGVLLDVASGRNGTLHVDVRKDASSEVWSGRRRGSRWRRTFYRIVPFLLIPPLIMAAILPFKLPAFMMLSMGAVILNNMAFTGSLFTLLRNNAFNDDYEKKVIYVNEGYRNEEPYPAFPEGSFPEGFKGAFPEGLPAESVQGETFFPSDIKVKKRRGHKKKRRPVVDNGLDQGWQGQDPLGVAGAEGEPLEGLYQGSSGAEALDGGDQLLDFSNFRNTFRPKLKI